MSLDMNLIIELYSKPASYKFNKKELALIRKHLKNKRYSVKYGFYNKKSSKDRQIAFIIDSMDGSRKSAAENSWEYISERNLSQIEFEEQVQNFGCGTRRFHVWYYKTIEQLVADDNLYNIQTPAVFVDECQKRGYSGVFQLKLPL